MPRGLALALTMSLVAACGSPDVGFGVALTVRFDSSVGDSVLATVRSLDVVASGDEPYATSITLDHAAHRIERTVYRPDPGIHEVALSLIARDASGTALAQGATSDLHLTDGKTTLATAVLEAIADGGDGGMPITGTVTVFAGQPGGAGSADGVGTSAFFDDPYGLAVDNATIYVFNAGSHTMSTIDRATKTVTRRVGVPWHPGGTRCICPRRAPPSRSAAPCTSTTRATTRFAATATDRLRSSSERATCPGRAPTDDSPTRTA